LYENDKIIQQPADFLKLSETYSSAATGFIHQMAGKCPYVTYVIIYNTVITKLYSNTSPPRLPVHCYLDQTHIIDLDVAYGYNQTVAWFVNMLFMWQCSFLFEMHFSKCAFICSQEKAIFSIHGVSTHSSSSVC